MESDKEKQKRRMKKYIHSSKGKETRKKYLSTPKGLEIKRKSARDWYNRNIDNQRKRARNYHRADTVKMNDRNSWLKRGYGISLDTYNILLETQNGVCCICEGKNENRLYKNLYVDHNHQTGKVRGLLCQKCNSCIGYARESVDILRKVVGYLEKHDKQ